MANQNHPANAPLRPSYIGYVSTARDALILFEAALQNVIDPILRRPHDRERAQMIRSGHVFIYNEQTSNIKRWTDGVDWSPSRILGNFLVYRQLEEPFPPGEKKRARKKSKNRNARISDPFPAGLKRANQDRGYPTTPNSSSSNRCSSDPNDAPERNLIGSLVDSYGFKEGGLVKRTMSINVGNINHHLVSYYTIEDVLSGQLQPPSKDPTLNSTEPRPDLLVRQNFRSPIEQSEQVLAAQQMGVLNGAYASYGYGGYRPTMLNQQPTLVNQPSLLVNQGTHSQTSLQQHQHQQQQQHHHQHHHHPHQHQQHQQESLPHHPHSNHHGAHSAHHNLTMAVYGNQTYTTAPSATSIFQPAPLHVTLPASTSQYHYHTPTAIAPPPSYTQYDSSAQTITLPQDPNHQPPPPPAGYHYSRHAFAAPSSSLPPSSIQSRVGSIDTATPTSDGKSSEPDWHRHSQNGNYSTLTSPISAQSAYAAPPTPWSATPNSLRDDWASYKTTPASESPSWRQGVPCT